MVKPGIIYGVKTDCGTSTVMLHFKSLKRQV